MPEPQRARNFARAERKFDLMHELGTELLLICSNVSPASLGGIDRAADDFCTNSASARRKRPCASATRRWPGDAMSTTIATPGRSCAAPIIPRSASSSTASNALAPGSPTRAMASIPGDKIFLVQLADAPKLELDILSVEPALPLLPRPGRSAGQRIHGRRSRQPATPARCRWRSSTTSSAPARPRRPRWTASAR